MAFGSGDSLKLVRVSGDGSPTEICKVPNGIFRGGAWSPDGEEIILPVYVDLYRVRASGGEPELLETAAHAERRGAGWRDPSFLPWDNRSLLLIEFETDQPENAVWVVDLETGFEQEIVRGRTPIYSSSGHILYQDNRRMDRIWALPFSLDSLETSGEPFAVADKAAAPSISAAGTLVYLRDSPGPAERIVWRDRSGGLVHVASGPVEGALYPTLSPGGEALAFRAAANDENDIWIVDLGEIAGEPRRLTFEGTISTQFAWSPDGARLLYNAIQGGEITLHVRPTTGGEPIQLDGPERPLVSDWWGDGSREHMVIHAPMNPEDRTTIVVMFGPPATESKSEFRPLKRAENSAFGKLSPDGDYIVFVGGFPEPQILVRSFPDGKGPWLVSRPGEYAVQPRWNRTANEIFYVVSDQLIAASVTTEPTFRVTDRTNILRSEGLEGNFAPQYDVTADGRRFVLFERVPEEEPTLLVTQNWYEEFRAREQD